MRLLRHFVPRNDKFYVPLYPDSSAIKLGEEKSVQSGGYFLSKISTILFSLIREIFIVIYFVLIITLYSVKRKDLINI